MAVSLYKGKTLDKIVREEGSIIGVFNTQEEAEEWVSKMSQELSIFKEKSIQVDITPINNRWRAGIVYKNVQMEFDFDQD